MDLLFGLTIPYAVAFLALFLLRRPLWLGIGLVGSGVVMFALVRWLDNSNGDGAIGVVLLLLSVGLGFIAGLLGRLLLIALGRGRELTRRSTVAVGVLFFLGAPLILFLFSQVGVIGRL